jgi:hypothetical protein
MSATSGPVNLVVSAPSPPSIYEESPRDITTATQTPRIRALLSSSSSTINVASTRLFVDGVNVSAQAQISAAQVLWVPATPIAQGLHQVRVETADANGLTASKDWQFTIALPPPPPTQQDIPDGVRSPISISPSIQAAQ